MIPASRIPRMTPLTAGLPRNAARSGRCRANAKVATKTRNSAIRSRNWRVRRMRRCSSSLAALSRSAAAITASPQNHPQAGPLPRNAAARASCACEVTPVVRDGRASRPVRRAGRTLAERRRGRQLNLSNDPAVCGWVPAPLGTGLLVVVDRVLEIVMRVVKLLHFGRAFFLALARRDAVLVSAQCIDHLGQRRLKGVVRAGAVEGPGSRRRYQSEGKEGGRHGARDDIHRSDGTPAENGSVMPPDGRPGSPA